MDFRFFQDYFSSPKPGWGEIPLLNSRRSGLTPASHHNWAGEKCFRMRRRAFASQSDFARVPVGLAMLFPSDRTVPTGLDSQLCLTAIPA